MTAYDPKNLSNTLGRKDWDNLVVSFGSAMEKAYQAGRRGALKEARDPTTETEFKEMLAEYGLAVMHSEKASASLSRAKSEYSKNVFRKSQQEAKDRARSVVKEMVDKFVGTKKP